METQGRQRVSAALTCALFLRLFGLISCVHFLDLLPQISALIGNNGLIPARDIIARLQEGGPWLKLFYPTLAWLSTDTRFIQALAATGAVASLAVAMGVFRTWIFLWIWILQCSLMNVGSLFLVYLWDSALAQIALIAFFIVGPRNTSEKVSLRDGAGLFMLRFLYFHIMFMMAYTKAFSSDPAWRNADFLRHFLVAQPMPTIVAWALRQLPDLALRALTGFGLFLEVALVFAVFIPSRFDRVRITACVASISLQAFIFLCGNFGYFNLLMGALSLVLLNDRQLAKLASLKTPHPTTAVCEPLRRTPREIAAYAMALLFVTGNLLISGHMVFNQEKVSSANQSWIWDRPKSEADLFIKSYLRVLQPYQLVRAYDLFGNIPNRRLELRLYASGDGENWFELSPPHRGNLRDFPRFAPFQDRLDYTLYYPLLALAFQDRPYNWYLDTMWVHLIANKILLGTPEVRHAFASEPRIEGTPRFVQLRAIEFAFTDYSTWKKTGEFWQSRVVLQSRIASLANPMPPNLGLQALKETDGGAD